MTVAFVPTGAYKGVTATVTSGAELQQALAIAMAAPADSGYFQIVLAGNIILTSNLPKLTMAVGNSVDIVGLGAATIDGAGLFTGFSGVTGDGALYAENNNPNDIVTSTGATGSERYGAAVLQLNGVTLTNIAPTVFNVSNEAQLLAAINTINADNQPITITNKVAGFGTTTSTFSPINAPYAGVVSAYTINIAADAQLVLNASLPSLTANANVAVTVNGNGATLISENNAIANFTTAGAVTVNDLQLADNGGTTLLQTDYAHGGPYVEYYQVNNENDLINGINLVNEIAQDGEGGEIAVDLLFAPGVTITLTQNLPQITTNLAAYLVIDGDGATIDGQGKFTGLNGIVGYTSASQPAVFINNLTFANIAPQTFAVGNAAQLASAVATINAADSTNVLGGDYTGAAATYEIDLTASSAIDLTSSQLLSPAPGVEVAVVGNGALVNGGLAYSAFTSTAASAGNVNISGVRFEGMGNPAVPGNAASLSLSASTAAQFQAAIGTINAGPTAVYRIFGTTIGNQPIPPGLVYNGGGAVDYVLSVPEGTDITLPSGGIPALQANGEYVTTSITGTLTLDVANQADLVNAIKLIDGLAATDPVDSPNVVISIAAGTTIDLSADLPMLTVGNGNSLVIDGHGATIDGGNLYQGFLVYSGAATIDNLTLLDTRAQGGAGGSSAGGGGGGGGAGLGGGLFVGAAAAVTLNNVAFTGATAVGGKGGNASLTLNSTNGDGGGGGGGMGGNGANSPWAGSLDSHDVGAGGGGGGGGLGIGANGGSSTGSPGAGGIAYGYGPAGSGGGLSFTTHYFVTSHTDYDDGGSGGGAGGGGGNGWGVGGGGGGVGSETVDDYYLGSTGIAFSFDPVSFVTAVLITLVLSAATGGAGAVEGVAEGAALVTSEAAADAAASVASSVAESAAVSAAEDGLAASAESVVKAEAASVSEGFGASAWNVVKQIPSYIGNKILTIPGAVGVAIFQKFTPLGVLKDAIQADAHALVNSLGGPDPIILLNGTPTVAPDGYNKNLFFGIGFDYASTSNTGAIPGGGIGGFGGGGGGGGAKALGGQGGFGGGGGGSGASVDPSAPHGGFGGFGGGAGAGGNSAQNGQPGFGGGSAGNGTGGGGLAAGGAVFVQNGGSITIAGASTVQGSVTGGASGGGTATAGSAYGGGIFLNGNETLDLAPGAGQVQRIGDIADQAGSDLLYASSQFMFDSYAGSVLVDGAGTVQMGGDDSYLGGTYVQSGTLELVAGASLNPFGFVDLTGGTLRIDAGATLFSTLYVDGGGTATVDLAGSFYGLIGGDSTVEFLGSGPLGLLQGGFSTTDFYDGWNDVNAQGQTLRAVSDLQLGATAAVANGAGELQSLLTWIALADGPSFVGGSQAFDISLDGGVAGAFSAGAIYIPTLAAGQSVVLDDSGQYFGGNPLAGSTLTLGGALTVNDTTPTTLLVAAGQTLDVTAAITADTGGLLGIAGVNGTSRVVLAGTNALSGTISLAGGVLELASGAASGATSIAFTAAGTLVVDRGALPSGAIAGFVAGDTIDLAGIAPPSSQWLALGAGGALVLGAGQTLDFAGLAAGTRLRVVSDGSGGSAITLNEYAVTVANAAQLNAALAAARPVGADLAITVAAPGGVLTDATLPTPDLAQDERFTLLGNGGTLVGGGGAGLVIDGTASLTALTVAGFAGPALVVGSGATPVLQGVTVDGTVALAAGVTLDMASGVLGGSSGAGQVLATPTAGATVRIAGSLAGDLLIGDTATLAGTLAAPSGGVVLFGAGAAVGGTVDLLTRTTLELAAGVGGVPVSFASPTGAVLRIDGTILPSATISLPAGSGTIDLASVATANPQVLTLGAGNLLAVPGAAGALHFGASEAAGATFLMTSDGLGGSLILPMAQSATITTEAEYAALVPALNALPGGAGLSFTIDIPSGLSLGATPALLSPAAAVSLQGAGGIVVGAGVAFALAAGNGFAGGVTLAAGSTLSLGDPGTLGSEAVTFAGSGSTLVVAGTAGLASALHGWGPGDTLDLAGVATAAGTLSVDLAHDLTLPTAAGSVVLNVADLSPTAVIVASSDGHGGTDLINPYAQQSFTVSTEAQLDAALLGASSATANTTIILAPGAKFALTHALTALSPTGGTHVFIEGNGDTIDGGGQWGGLFVATGNVYVQDLTLANMATKGGNGTNGSQWGGGGGAGLGGGLYVGSLAKVVLDGVALLDDSATGGSGGRAVAGAGADAGGAGDGNSGGAGLVGDGGSGFGTIGYGYGNYVPTAPQFGGGGGGYQGGPTGGGGGTGAGGGIYVDAGGGLTVLGAANESGGSVAGGASGDGGNASGLAAWPEPFGLDADLPGQAYGAGIFYAGSGQIDFAPESGSEQRIADPIADELGVAAPQTPAGYLNQLYPTNVSTSTVSLMMTGAGTLELDAANSYAGTTDVENGTLVLGGGLSGLLGAMVDNATIALVETADTGFGGSIVGTGELLRAGNGLVTIGGSVSLGSLSVSAGGLALLGSAAFAHGAQVAGTLTLGGSFAGTISGDGTVIADSASGIRLAQADALGGRLVLAGGALTLAAAGAAGTATIAFASGANAVLTVAAGVALSNMVSGFVAGNTIDLQGIGSPVGNPVLSGNTLLVSTNIGTTAITLDPVLANDGTLFTVASDGAGGTLIRSISSRITVSDEAQFNGAVAAISLGGAQNGAAQSDTITVAGTQYNPAPFAGDSSIQTDTALQTIDLGSTTTLDLVAPSYFSFFNAAGTPSGPASPVSPLDVRSGTVRFDSPGGLSAWSWDYYDYHDNGHGQISGGLDVEAAATVVLDVGGLVNLGASTIDGTLDLLNGSGFAAGLVGTGQLVLDTGANVVNLGGGGFAGTITVRSGDVTALPTAFSALIMDGGTAELAGATATGRIVFAPNADATLQLDGTSGPKLGGVIYGFAPGDLIAAFLPQNPGQPQQSDPFYATTLGAGNLLTVTTGYGQAQYQFDPSQSFAGEIFTIQNGEIGLAPTGYTVSTAAQLAAAISAISTGNASAANTSYTITLAADLTGANALSGSLPQIALAAGSTLSVFGQGHTIDGGGATIFYDAGSSLATSIGASSGTLSLSNITLIDASENASSFAGAVIASRATLSNVSIIDGGLGSLGALGPYNPNGNLIEAPGVGQTVNFTGTLARGTLDVVGPGTVVWAAPAGGGYEGVDAAVTVQGGTLELAGATNAQLANVALLGGTLRIDPASTGQIYVSQFAGGTLDFAGVAPAVLSGYQTQIFGAYGATPAAMLNNVLIAGATLGLLAATSDGLGGSYVFQTTNSFTAGDEAGLNTAVAAISVGGAQFVPVLASETITLAPPSGTLSLATPLQGVSLSASGALLFNGQGAVIDGGGSQGGLAVAAGTVTIENASFADMTPGSVALAIGAGAQATLANLNFTGVGVTALSLGAGAVASLVGNSFAAGSTIALGQGAQLQLENTSIGAGLAGNGTVDVTGNVTLQAPGSLSGTIVVGGTKAYFGGLLDLAASGAAGSATIALGHGGGGTLEIAPGVVVANAITGLTHYGLIQLDGISDASGSLANGVLTVSGTGGTKQLDLADAGLQAQDLEIGNDLTGGTWISDVPRSLASVSVSANAAIGAVPLGLTSETITVANNSINGDAITGGFGSLGAGLAGTGSLNVQPGQVGTLTLFVVAGAEGAFSSTASLSLMSSAYDRISVPIGTAPIMVQGSVYALPTPVLPKTLDLGAARLGGAALTAQVTIANGTMADPNAECLAYAASASGLSLTGASGTLVAGGSATLGVTLSSTTMGLQTASVGVALTAVGTGSVANAALATSSIAVTGTLYAQAVAQLPGSVNFGIVHVGDTTSQSLAITNANLAGAYADVLSGSATAASAGFSVQGTLAAVAASGTGTLNVAMSTAASGIMTGSTTLSLASQDAALADVTSSATVALAGTVDSYATLALGSTGGGVLTGSGNSYTLDLGEITGAVTADLDISNGASGLADLLSGSFSEVGSSSFINTGFAGFNGLGAGQGDAAPRIELIPSSVGVQSETIVISGTGSNASGYVGALAPVTLTVRGTVALAGGVATDETALNTFITAISQGGSLAGSSTNYAVTLEPSGGTLSLTTPLAQVNLPTGASLTIVGAGTTIDGGGNQSGFTVTSGALNLQGLVLQAMPNDLVVDNNAAADLAGVSFAANTNALAANIAVAPGGSLLFTAGTIGAATAASPAVTMTGQTLTLAPAAGQTIEIDGAITAAALAVTGPGTLRLAGRSGYTGGTTVQGTLALAAGSAAGTGGIALATGAVLAVAGTGTLANVVAGFVGGTIDAMSIQSGTASLNGGTLVIANATQSLTIDLAAADLSTYGLSVVGDGAGGTAVTEIVALAHERTGTPVLAPGSLTFADVHVGGVATATIAVSNTLAAGGDSFVGGFGDATGPFAGGGSVDLLPGGSGSLDVTEATGVAGSFNATLPLAFDYVSPLAALRPVAGESLAVAGAVFALAAPSLVPGTVDLGAIRVGGTLTGALTLANTVQAPAGYQENLDYALAFANAALITQAPGMVASGATAAIGVTLAAANAGALLALGTLSLTSDGTGIDSLGTTALAGQSIAFTGTAFAPAVAMVAGTLDLGWVHLGGTLSGSIALSNLGSGAYADSLAATLLAGPAGTAINAASITIASGGGGSLALNLVPSVAGALSGNVTVGLLSEDAALPNLALANGTVAVTGTVVSYATLDLVETSGGGTLSNVGGVETLDLGSVAQAQTIGIAALNAATGLSDFLAGTITAGSGGPDISAGGAVSFTGLGAGQTGAALSLSLVPTLGGAFSETLVASATGSDAMGYSGALAATTLVVTGTAVYGPYVFAAPVSTFDQLNADIAAIENGGSLADINTAYTLDLAGGTLALTGALAEISLLAGSSLTIMGNGATIDGGGQQRGFVVAVGTLDLENLTIANAAALGAPGVDGLYSGGGGGAAGLGGGLFVGSGAVATLSGVAFTGDSATGGAGGGYSGYESSIGTGGTSQLPGGIGAGAAGGQQYNGATLATAGFGGGGGGGGYGAMNPGGQAGFGGGAGSGSTFYQGYIYPGGGGGGLGAGADVFVHTGGSLDAQSGTLNAGVVAGGAGGTVALYQDYYNGGQLTRYYHGTANVGSAGAGLGTTVFVQSGGTISYTPQAGQILALGGSPASDGAVPIVTLNGPGTLSVAVASGFTSAVDIAEGSFLLTSTGTVTYTGAISGPGALKVAQAGTDDLTLAGSLALSGGISVTGGTLILGGSGPGVTGTVTGAAAIGLAAGAALALGQATGTDQFLLAGGTLGLAGASLTGSGTVTRTGAGFAIAATNGAILLAGGASYSGGTAVSGTLDLSAGSAAGSGIIALAAGAMLGVAGSGTLANVVDGFVGGTIDASTIHGGSVSLSGAQLVIANVTQSLTIDLAQTNLSAAGLSVTSDAGGGTEVTEIPGLEHELLAAPVLSTGSVDFGQVHVGGTAAASVTVTNNVTSGGDTLVAGFAAAAAPFGGSGSLDLAPGGVGTLTLAEATGTAGLFSGALTLALNSVSPLSTLQPLPAGTVAASGTVFALAAPALTTLDLGAIRLGGSVSGTIDLTNLADAPAGYQEALDYAIGTPGAGLTVSGNGQLSPGAAVALAVGLTPEQSGTVSLTAPVTLTSDGTGIDTLGTTTLASQALTATATVYAAATPLMAGTIDLGWEHVDETAWLLGSITVQNGATGALTDGLVPLVVGALPTVTGFTSLGLPLTFITGIGGVPVTQLAAGQTGTLTLGYTPTGPAVARVLSGTLTVDLTSRDPALPDLALSPATITLTGTIGNYATLALSETSGGGAWTAANNNYTLDLGAITASRTIDLAISNTASGPADTLSGSISVLAGSPSITTFGTADFAGLAAGAADNALALVATPAYAGVFTETLVVSGTGSDPGGYSGAVATQTLTVTGTVTPKATLGLTEIVGGGSFAGSGSHYTLDLGTLQGAASFGLAITNTGTDGTHTLSGSITASGGGPDMTVNGTNAFAGLASGQADTALSLVTAAGTAGAFSETLVIAGTDIGPGTSVQLDPVTLVVTGTIAAGSYSFAAPVTSLAQLNADLTAISSGGSLALADTAYTIDLAGGTVGLTASLTQISLLNGSRVTIVGNGATIDGEGAQRGFVIAAGTLELQNLTIANAVAAGAAGQNANTYEGGAGGGAAGLGGGLFVAAGAEAITSGVSFVGDAAIGGAGGDVTTTSAYVVTGGTSDLPGGMGAGGGGGSDASRNAGFGGGGGGGSQAYSGIGTTNAGSGGFGGGNGQPGVVINGIDYAGAGGGGLGAGADAFVATGGTLLVQDGTLGDGMVAGGAAGAIVNPNVYDYLTIPSPAGAGSALGGAIFVQPGGTVGLAASAGTNLLVGGGVDTDAAGTLTISGGGTVTLAGTLVPTGSIAGSLGTGPVADNGNLVLLGAQSGSLVSTATRSGFVGGEVLTLKAVNYGNYSISHATVTLGACGSLADLAAAIDSVSVQTQVTATVAAGVLTLTSGAGALVDFSIANSSGAPISGVTLGGYGAGDFGGTLDVSLNPTSADPTHVSATMSLSGGLAATDAIALNGTVVTVGGSGGMSDLAAAINAAGIIGVSASLDAGLHLAITSSLTALTLQDAVGTPLETLGLAAGTVQGARSFDGPINGAGNLTIQQSSGESMTLSGPVALTGTTDLTAGTLDLTGSLTGMTGTIENNGTVVFGAVAADSFAGALIGSGTELVANGGSLKLNRTVASGNTVALGGTVSTGTLELGAGVSFQGTLSGFYGVGNLLVIDNIGTEAPTLNWVQTTASSGTLGVSISGTVTNTVTIAGSHPGGFTYSTDTAVNGLMISALDNAPPVSLSETGPGLSLGVLTNGTNILQGTLGTIALATTAGAVVTLYDSGNVVGTGTADGSGNVSISAAALGVGTHVLTAVAAGSGTISAATTLIVAGAAQTQFVLGAGNDRLVGGANGSVVFVNTTGTVNINLGDGNDDIFAAGSTATVALGNGTNEVLGGNGNDVVTTGSGNNSIYLGSGNDSITAGGGINHFILGNGTNTVSAGNGQNEMELGGGANSVTVGNGNNYIQAGNGNDVVNAGTGNSGIQLGNGNNSVSVTGGSDIIILGDGTNTVSLGASMSFLRVGNGNNTVSATSGNEQIDIYGSGNNALTLGSGNNLIYGGGNDAISLGSGNNTVSMTDGSDSITGGNGANAVTLYSTVSSSTVVLGNGNNTVIVGGGGASITLGSGNNYVEALGGNNTITVGGGSNVVKGDSGNDVFNVTAGYVHGNGPTDVFNLGSGGGAAYGGWGANSINISSGAWYVAAAAGSDRIEMTGVGGFAYVQMFDVSKDMLVLGNAAFGLGVGGLTGSATQAVGALLSGNTDGTFSGNSLLAYNAASGVLYDRANTSSGGVAVATFVNDPTNVASRLFVGA